MTIQPTSAPVYTTNTPGTLGHHSFTANFTTTIPEGVNLGLVAVGVGEWGNFVVVVINPRCACARGIIMVLTLCVCVCEESTA